MEYVSSAVGWSKDEFGGVTRFFSIAAITIILAMINYTGLEIVGNASLVICVIAMSPFLIMTIIGAPQVVPSRWFQMPEVEADGSSELFDDSFQTDPGPLPLLTLGGIIWRPYLNNMFWNLNSFDAAASFASETTSVSTTFPRGMFLGLAMVVFGYVVPLLVAVGATDYSQADWVDGFLENVAVDIGGKWLGVWTVFAAGISNVAMFEAEMSSDSYQLMGMGKSFLLCIPSVLLIFALFFTNDNSFCLTKSKPNVAMFPIYLQPDRSLALQQLGSYLTRL
jgi:amino acid transporter